MKKIMFNDMYGLTEAVLDESKTITRRIITCPKSHKGQYVSGFRVCKRSDGTIVDCPELLDEDVRWFDDGACILPKYKVGEIVAVAQSYRKMAEEVMTEEEIREAEIEGRIWSSSAGWNNKMFVKADRMPHRIQIANIRIEKLQDISDEDCSAEGIGFSPREGLYVWCGCKCKGFLSPREAYAALIDKISGNGTWKSNPYVFVYGFKLIK